MRQGRKSKDKTQLLSPGGSDKEELQGMNTLVEKTS